MTISACEALVHSLVTSSLGYDNAVLFGITDCLIHRLVMIQLSELSWKAQPGRIQ